MAYIGQSIAAKQWDAYDKLEMDNKLSDKASLTSNQTFTGENAFTESVIVSNDHSFRGKRTDGAIRSLTGIASDNTQFIGSNGLPISFRNKATHAFTPINDTDLVNKEYADSCGVKVHNELTGRSTTDAHPTSAITGLDNALSGKASLTDSQTFTGVNTFDELVSCPEVPTNSNHLVNKGYVDNNSSFGKINTFTKPINFQPLFKKLTPHSIKIPAGLIVEVNSIIFEVETDYTLDLDTTDLLIPEIKTAGTDYCVYAKSNKTFYISSNNNITADRKIGGFHYGLTPEAESATENKTNADMVQIRGINAYSFWDLTWLSANGDARGMHYKFGIWVDIYQTDEDYGIRGYSKAGGKIAGGTTDYGRGIPKIPLVFGGDGTLTYGKYTWFQASEVGKAFKKRLLKYEEFIAFAYGVDEGKSSSTNGYETTAGQIEHYPNLTSATGMEQATGVQYVWGADFGTSSSGSWSSITDGRGQVYTNANPVILGGHRDDAGGAGSRCSGWYRSLSGLNWDIGSRFACDHLILD